MAEYTYDQLLKLPDDELASLGFVKNNRGGITRIKSGVSSDDPPTLTNRGAIVPMNYDEIRRQAGESEQPPKKPCGGCRGQNKETRIGQLKKLAAAGRDFIKGEKTLGIAQYLRVKAGSKVDERTRSTRMQLCMNCEEKSTADNTRLFRTVGGTPYCGIPRNREMLRNEKDVGCGCDLTDKVLWWKASCPRDKWGEGPNMGPGAKLLAPVTRKRKELEGVIDIRSRTKEATDYTGIGDIVAALPVVHALAVTRSKRVRYRVIEARVPWAQLGWPDVCVDREDTDIGEEVIDINLYGAIDLDRKLEESGKNRHEHWFEAAGVKPFKPHLFPDTEGLSWAREQLAEARRNGKRVVALSPFANAPARQWPLHHWIDLADKLMKENYHVIMIDSDPQRGRFMPCQRYWGWKPTHVSALLTETDLYVGNDSGMTHLAGVFDVNTIAICSVTSGKTVFGWYDSVEVIQATNECSGCLWREERGHRRACLTTCEALWDTSPNLVFDRSMRSLEENAKKRNVAVQSQPA